MNGSLSQAERLRQNLILYPFLLAAYPVLTLLAANRSEVEPQAALRPLLLLLLATALFLLVARPLFHSWRRAALLVSLFLLLFFSYGHVLNVSSELEWLSAGLAAPLLSLLWLTLFLVGGILIWRRLADVSPRATTALNAVALATLLLPLYTVTAYYGRTLVGGEDAAAFLGPPPALSPAAAPEPLPDIYYIILDGYGRHDVLRQLYDYDNSSFLATLEERGFFVAANSHTNYVKTIHSLPSSLNMTYLDGLAAEVTDGTNLQPFEQALQNNRLFASLRQVGYKIVASSGYDVTQLTGADLNLQAGERSLSSFERLLLQNTPLNSHVQDWVTDGQDSHALQRLRILFGFAALQETARDPDPTFMVVHIVAPHPPFVFAPDGRPVQPDHHFTLADGSDYPGNRPGYLAGYRQQIQYVDQLVLEAVDSLLATSRPAPIIVIQADHGPGSLLSWAAAELTCVHERAGILNAYYLPGSPEARAALYDSISPVNSFRIILNGYFGASLPLLPDKSYYSTWPTLNQFVDVTERVDDECIVPAP